MEAIRVVLADDNETVRSSIRRLLDREEDIQIIAEAANGLEAVRAVQVHSPHVLLLDLNMPVMNGLQVIKELSAAHLPIHILVLSTYSDRQYITGVLKYGVDGYLVKDDSPDQLVDAIRQIARGETNVFSHQALQSLPVALSRDRVLVIIK